MDDIAINIKAPTIVELTITGKCNHKCLHCYNPWRTEVERELSNKTLTREQIDYIFEECKKNEVFHIVLSGGEPITEFETTMYALKKFSEGGFSVALNSNLSLLNYSHIEQLKACSINFLLTSLPSSNKEICTEIIQVNTFNKIVEGIELCIKNGINVGVNTVINKKNINTVFETAQYLASLGINSFFASIAIPPYYDLENSDYQLSDDDIKELGDILVRITDVLKMKVSTVTPLPLCVLKDVYYYRNITTKSCTGGITHCTISNNGDITACSHEDRPYGNIFNEGLKESWKKMEIWRNGDNLNYNCASCDYLKICGGECRVLTKSLPDRKYDKQVVNADKIRIDNITVPEGEFSLNPTMRFRTEKFGGTVCIEGTKNVFLSHDGVVLLELLMEMKQFNMESLDEYIEIDDVLLEALNNFISNDIVIVNQFV